MNIKEELLINARKLSKLNETDLCFALLDIIAEVKETEVTTPNVTTPNTTTPAMPNQPNKPKVNKPGAPPTTPAKPTQPEQPKPVGSPSAPTVKSASLSNHKVTEVAGEVLEYLTNKFNIKEPFMIDANIEEQVINAYFSFIASRGFDALDAMTIVRYLPANLRYILPTDKIPDEFINKIK